MIGEILLITFSFLLVLAGILGVILPFLPGVPLAWLGMLIFAYVTEFAIITWGTLLFFLGFTVLTLLLDILAPMLGAKKYNASRYGLIGAGAGVILGIMVFGPIGIVIGPFLGALAGEMVSGKLFDDAVRAAIGALLGILAGSAIKLALVIVMLGFLIVALF